jgi:flavin-dependent dehydrogenase
MEPYDALIIGGGPGGSTAATYLARAGKRVLLLEKEFFPRFHIGESLLPYNLRLFREMGIMPQIEAAGFVRKLGAQFHLGNASKACKFVFRDGRFNDEPEAVQVERAVFDHLLLKHARTSGADVREGWTVGKFSRGTKTVSIEATGPDGVKTVFEGSFLIDASGRGNLTGNQEGQRVYHEKLKKLAVFGHFNGVWVEPGDRGGDTVIVRLDNKWFWVIPLSKEKISVGCVMDAAEFAAMKLPPAEVFEKIWKSSPEMRKRMENTKLVGVIHTAGDFSYHNRRLVGPRLLRVGDAAGFMDPIFSSGVYIAMFTGRNAAQEVIKSLAAGDDGGRRFLAYEKRSRKAMRFYWEMVENYYTTPFMQLILEPREKFSLASAVNAVLAGQLEGGWRLRWRMRLFFWLVKLQGFVPLVPRSAIQ